MVNVNVNVTTLLISIFFTRYNIIFIYASQPTKTTPILLLELSFFVILNKWIEKRNYVPEKWRRNRRSEFDNDYDTNDDNDYGVK